MNYRKWIVRSLIVWLAVWDVIGWIGYKQFNRGQFALVSASSQPALYQSGAHDLAAGKSLELMAALFGFFIPILLIIMGLSLRWTWRKVRDARS